MTDLLHAQFPEGIQTYRAVSGEYPRQLDHVFVSNNLASACGISIYDSSEVLKMSDHNPVILDFC
jgi:endonuclease/exonuclease/phosphatase family metal-dependent hydrolase